MRNCGLRAGDMSSVDIPPGMTVTLFDQSNFKGRKLVLKGPMDANGNCLAQAKFENNYWNDRVQSVIVEGPDHHVG